MRMLHCIITFIKGFSILKIRNLLTFAFKRFSIFI